MIKVSTLAIGIVIASLFMAIIGGVIANVSKNYGVSTGNVDFGAYNKIDNMSSYSQDIANRTSEIKSTSIIDILGGYLASAYQIMTITPKMVSTTAQLTDQALTDSHLGSESTRLFRVAVGVMVVIAIFIGVILSAIVRRDL